MPRNVVIPIHGTRFVAMHMRSIAGERNQVRHRRLLYTASSRSRLGSARSRIGSARSRIGSARSRLGSARSRIGSARSRLGGAPSPVTSDVMCHTTGILA
jgi:hypothetical protein